MNRLSDDVQHELERGVILNILLQVDLEEIPVRALPGHLSAQGFFIDARELTFHLNYLELGGYIARRSLRSGRADMELLIVRATKKAADLHDGRIAADEGIRF